MTERRLRSEYVTEPVPVRDAATVVLLRDGTDGLEAWLLTRVAQMAFAAGMTVFPGGRVDDSDSRLPVAVADVERVAARFDCDAVLARALVGAAARETFEETGVLLTAPRAHLPEHRADVENGVLAFGALLSEHGLTVDGAALRPWARWVTPEGENRRYDTRFFVGALPEGAEAQDVTTESSEAAWLPIALALEQGERGERSILPPTLVTLLGVQACGSVADVLAAADERIIAPVRPSLKIDDDGSVSIELDDGTRYPIPRSMLP
ncbi:NUDIX hydrolase [uncultured Jatrophihabitans sp.]|uniref:NUDIX hydrolase n=1 Tax=uncultured Jatrophihabitans sp. TaxID=1610747 RepID=UPI0035CA769A